MFNLLYPQRPEEGPGFPGIVTDGSELPGRCRESNPGPLEMQSALNQQSGSLVSSLIKSSLFTTLQTLPASRATSFPPYPKGPWLLINNPNPTLPTTKLTPPAVCHQSWVLPSFKLHIMKPCMVCSLIQLT